MIYWIIYKELVDSLIYDSSYHQLRVQSSTYQRQVGIDDIGRRYSTTTVGSTESQEILSMTRRFGLEKVNGVIGNHPRM